jgi:hypothetical protein
MMGYLSDKDFRLQYKKAKISNGFAVIHHTKEISEEWIQFMDGSWYSYNYNFTPYGKE